MRIQIVLLLSGGLWAASSSVVVLDPGHAVKNAAGRMVNPGAKSQSGLLEREIALDVAERLRPLLEKRGFAVWMTRDSQNPWRIAESQEEDNKARAEFSNSKKPFLFLRLHCDWNPDKNRRGISVYFQKENSRRAAQRLHENLIRRMKIQDAGLHQKTLVGFERSEFPAVLVEMGFLSNPQDTRLLFSPEFRQRMAQAIAESLKEIR